MVVIDAFNFIYRAIGVVTGKKMTAEGYLYGDIGKSFLQVFFKMFNKIYKSFRRQEIIIAWEGDGKSFRYDLCCKAFISIQRGNQIERNMLASKHVSISRF